MHVLRRALAYLWALPMIGLVPGTVALATGGHAAVVDGVLEARGARPYRDNRFERQAFAIGDRSTTWRAL
jgi:hypothetical protein